MKFILILLLLLLIEIRLPFATYAGPSSTHYQLKSYGFGAGGTTTNTSSTNYGLFGSVGEIEHGKSSSAHYQAGTGLNYLLKLNVPPAPTVLNPATNYDRLQIIVNQGSNASDVIYAISISTNSAFTSNVKYVKADMTIGNTITIADYKSYANWGGSSGFFVTNLTSGTTYYIRARARVGSNGFTETEWGPTSVGVATSNSTLTFTLNNSAITFNPLTVSNAYTDSSESTILTTSTNAYNGYTVYTKETQPLTSPKGVIADYVSPNSSPTTWSGVGFGYTTNNNNLHSGGGAANRFAAGTNYAGFTQASSTAGDPVADHIGPIQSTPITNEQYTVSYRVTGANTTAAGTYKTTILYTIVAGY